MHALFKSGQESGVGLLIEDANNKWVSMDFQLEKIVEEGFGHPMEKLVNRRLNQLRMNRPQVTLGSRSYLDPFVFDLDGNAERILSEVYFPTGPMTKTVEKNQMGSIQEPKNPFQARFESPNEILARLSPLKPPLSAQSQKMSRIPTALPSTPFQGSFLSHKQSEREVFGASQKGLSREWKRGERDSIKNHSRVSPHLSPERSINSMKIIHNHKGKSLEIHPIMKKLERSETCKKQREPSLNEMKSSKETKKKLNESPFPFQNQKEIKKEMGCITAKTQRETQEAKEPKLYHVEPEHLKTKRNSSGTNQQKRKTQENETRNFSSLNGPCQLNSKLLDHNSLNFRSQNHVKEDQNFRGIEKKNKGYVVGPHVFSFDFDLRRKSPEDDQEEERIHEICKQIEEDEMKLKNYCSCWDYVQKIKSKDDYESVKPKKNSK